MQIINWIIRIIGLAFMIAFQILVLNNLNLGIYIHPYIYPMFIFMLPIHVPRWLLMVMGFLTGLIIDMFNNTPGMHASACIVIAYLREPILKILTPPTGYEAVDAPTLKYLGISWFIIYTLIMIFIHHLIYFFVEILSLNNLSYTFLKILLSGILSSILVLILTFLFSSRVDRKT